MIMNKNSLMKNNNSHNKESLFKNIYKYKPPKKIIIKCKNIYKYN